MCKRSVVNDNVSVYCPLIFCKMYSHIKKNISHQHIEAYVHIAKSRPRHPDSFRDKPLGSSQSNCIYTKSLIILGMGVSHFVIQTLLSQPHSLFPLRLTAFIHPFPRCALQRWVDEFLRWDPAQYGGVEHVWVPAMDIWKPDIFINNL